jgi:hypothetical protein
MFDEENNIVADVNITEEPNVSSTPEQLQEPIQAPPTAAQETTQERNFRALLEKNRRLERERDEALRLAQEKQNPTPLEEPEEELNLGADEIAEGKHMKILSKKLQKMEEKLRNYEQKSTTMSQEAMLKAQYPDIELVVSKANMDELREQDPEFAELLDTSTNFRSKVVSAYKQIKKLGIHVEDNYKADREIAQRNASKPKPLASVSPQQGDSPLSRANAFANGLTEELKSQLRKEMEDARKNR